MTKKEKRERKKQDKGIVDFMMVTNHFFHRIHWCQAPMVGSFY